MWCGDINISLETHHGCLVILYNYHLLVSINVSFPSWFFSMDYLHILHISHLPNILHMLHIVSDLRHSDQRPVRRHDGQGEAAALVPEDDGRLPGHPLRQLHHQLEGRQALQRRHTQTLVSTEHFPYCLHPASDAESCGERSAWRQMSHCFMCPLPQNIKCTWLQLRCKQ